MRNFSGRSLPVRFALIALASLPGASLAAGYAVPNTNPRDLAMGGSAVANQTGAEAAFANGAALAGLEGLRITTGGALLWFHSTWTDTADAAHAPVSTNAGPALPPSFSASYGGKYEGYPWAVGLSFQVPGGGQVQWPSDWPGRTRIVSVSRRIYTTDLVGALQPIPELRASAGLSFVYGAEELKQALVFGGSPDGVSTIATSGGKLSYALALEGRPLATLPLKLGLQYRHKADLSMTGQVHFEGVPTPLSASFLDQGVTHPLTFPNVLEVGAAYEVRRDLWVQAAFTLWRFIVEKQDLFVGDRGLLLSIPFHDTNSQAYRLGAEWSGLLGLVPKLQLRAGLVRDVSPQRTWTLNPALPESSRWAVCAGAGYDVLPNLTVNAALEVAMFDAITAGGPDLFAGSYDTGATTFSLGVSWHSR
jgi:long-chain fatty acid transport protein